MEEKDKAKRYKNKDKNKKEKKNKGKKSKSKVRKVNLSHFVRKEKCVRELFPSEKTGQKKSCGRAPKA